MKPFRKMGACVDQLYRLRTRRLALQRRVDDMKKDERLLEDHLLHTFGRDDLGSAAGSLARASVSQQEVPQVKDWDKVWDYIERYRAWDMLHRRVATEAWRARIERGEVVPGIEGFTTTKLNVTKKSR